MTAEELLKMPDDGFRYELIQGELIKMTLGGHEHGGIAANLALPLGQHVKANRLGEVYATGTGFQLASNPDSVRAPDVAFVRRERVEAVGRSDGYWPGAPDLATEVISPGDLYIDVEQKVFDWLTAGTRMVIVVNPKRQSATVYRSVGKIAVLSADDTIDGGDVVPGWTMSVSDLFV